MKKKKGGGERRPYRALVLNKHPNTMRTLFRKLLHDFGKVDCEEKISPREFSKHVNFFVGHCPIGQDSGPCHRAPRRAEHVVFHPAKLGILREVPKAISEEAYRLN